MLEHEFKPCRYPVGEMNGSTFFHIGHITAAVPPGARVITLATPDAASQSPFRATAP